MIIKALVLGNICSDHWRKAQSIWSQNTFLLPQGINGVRPHFVRKRTFSYRRCEKMGPGPIYSQGFALLSLGEKPCPLSLSHGFSPYSHRQAGSEKKGTGYFFSKKKKVSTHGQNNRKSSLSPFSPRSGPASMSEQSELRRRREERMENGVINLKGVRLFTKTCALVKKEGKGRI